jgi:hypothetical protein
MRTGLTLNVLCLAAFGCLGLALAPRASAGACAMPRVLMEIVPSERDAIPSDQGILLRAGTDPRRAVGDAPERFSDAAIRIDAHLEREGAEPIALELEQVGPSLARLVPATAPASGTWQLVSASGRHDVRFGAGPARGAPPARPRLASVVRRHTSLPGPRGSDDYLTVTARLRGGLARSANGVILFVRWGEQERAMLSQPRASLHGALFTLLEMGGRCAVVLPGQEPPPAGREVSVAAYDLYGRVGARSTTVTLTDAPDGLP